MRQASKPPSEQISDLRLARLLLWARLWLVRWAHLLPDFLFKPNFVLIERALATVVIVRADARANALGSPPPRARTTRPRGAPPGFRRQDMRCGVLRIVLGDLIQRTRHRDPTARIEALGALIGDIDKIIARIARRLRHGIGGTHMIAVRPPARAFASDAPKPDAAFADTS